MIENSLICKLINVQASMKEKNEKKIKNEDEIGKGKINNHKISRKCQ